MIYGRILLLFILGFGTCLVGMSLFKKIFRRNKTKRSKSNETAMSETLTDISDKGLLDSTNQSEFIDEKELIVESSQSSSSANSQSPINQTVRQTRRKLNSTLRKYRKTEKKLQRKKNQILQMKKEIDNLMQAIKNNELQMESLHAEFNDKELEMLAITSYITPESEAEIRKKEILCYKRYSNIKTAVDAQSVLTMIRQRQRALKTLEVLTFKKYWSIVHKKDKKSENSILLRAGLENWFRHFRLQDISNESIAHLEINNSAPEELPTDNGFDNSAFIPIMEASV